MPIRKAAALAAASLTAVALALPLTSPVDAAPGAAPSADPSGPAPGGAGSADSTPSDQFLEPWQRKYEAERAAGVEQRLRQGGKGPVTKLARGTFAKVAQTGSDKIFVVLAEFGRTSHSAYPADPDQTDATKYVGPVHNKIPKPNRKIDNSTNWRKSYGTNYYRNLYFNRMDDFYSDQSSGTYSVDGQVTEWVKTPFNIARYGRDLCGQVVCGNAQFLVRDAMSEWTKSKLDSGMTMPEITAYLKTFDVKDRYDFDEDGNFDEPDGFIDHFQIVHAGKDGADGDPVYGTDAIWSHKGYAQIEPFGTGPQGGAQLGGVNIGEGGVSDPDGSQVQFPDNPTGVWVGDYTMQPENGGLSVFAHEYGHDLGLPDLYDTSGNTGGASNSVEHWSLMAQSRGTTKSDPGIGDRPQPFGAWEKFQLGWLDYDTARAGRKGTFKLRPGQQTNGNAANGLIVVLPDKEVTRQLGDPCDACGERYYFSGTGNELDNTMTAEVDGGGPLTAKVRFDIEPGYDYAFLEATSDGKTWTSLATSQSYEGSDDGGANPDGTGLSGSTDGEWVDLTATVPDGTTGLRWHYKTDPAANGAGLQVDNITLGGTVIGDAETDEGWTYDGFKTTTGQDTSDYLNAYFVDNRQYVERDKTLSHVYNFGYTGRKANFVDFFGYEPGALISYWDTSYSDNNVGDHPGGGQILPVDARPMFFHYPDGSLARTKVSTYDSTFGLTRAENQTLHYNGKAYTIRGQRSVSTFDDTEDWWFDSDEHGSSPHVGFYQPGWFGVAVPKTGTTIQVVSVDKLGRMKVKVGTH